jgi:hypothetical protein
VIAGAQAETAAHKALPGRDQADPRHTEGGRLRAVTAWLEPNALFVSAVAAIGVISLALIPDHLNQDGWLSLIGGRYVATHGIPQHDTLNLLTHGVRWIDQQWLAQLTMYQLDRIGGLAMYSIFYVALALAGLGMAIAGARKLGGSERHVLWVLPLAGFLYFAGALQIRTQGFAYPLFVAVVWLLARAVRAPEDRRAYLVFPLLILWGNLHGSVSLGAGIAVIYGATLLLDDVRSAGLRRPWARIRLRTLAFLIGPPLCLLVTPYGTAIIKYYEVTLLNSTFSKVVTEWQPVTSIMLLAVPFFVLAFATIWLLGRSGSRTRVFDQLTLIALAAAAIFAIRNVTWFGLGVITLLPGLIGTVLRPARAPDRRAKLNLSLAGISLLILVVATIAVALRPTSWFERQYDQRAVRTVATALERQPNIRIFADVRYSDWLLWHDPAFAGHLAYDTRFELLTDSQILALANLTSPPGPHQRSILAGDRLLVLDPTNRPTTQILLNRPGTHVILRGKRVVVASATGA